MKSGNNTSMVVRGIKNEKGTCFLDVALQCILVMDCMRETFITLQHMPAPMSECLKRAFVERFQKMSHENHKFLQQRESSDSPEDILDLLIQTNSLHFGRTIERSGGIRSWTGEVCITLSAILDHLLITDGQTALVENFRGLYKTKFTCSLCNYTTEYHSCSTSSYGLGFITAYPFAMVDTIRSQRTIDEVSRFITMDDLFELCPTSWSRHGYHCCSFDRGYNLKNSTFVTTISKFPRVMILNVKLGDSYDDLWNGKIIFQEYLDLTPYKDKR